MHGQIEGRKVREGLRREINVYKKIKETPHLYATLENKPIFDQQLAVKEKALEKCSPRPLASQERDRARARFKLLKQAHSKGNTRVPGSITKSQGHKSPPGAPEQLLEQDRFWKDHNLDEGGNIVKVDRRTQRGLTAEMQDLNQILNQERTYFDSSTLFHDMRADDGSANAGIDFPSKTFAPGQNVPQEKWDAMFEKQSALEAELKEARELIRKLNESSSKDLCGTKTTRGGPCTMELSKDGRCQYHGKVR